MVSAREIKGLSPKKKKNLDSRNHESARTRREELSNIWSQEFRARKKVKVKVEPKNNSWDFDFTFTLGINVYSYLLKSIFDISVSKFFWK